MENFIDIGIDFGAENIVVVAIGYDNKGRTDYKLVNLHSSGSIKNYIGEKKLDHSIEIGNEVKISYIYHDSASEYNWICGRYKAFIAEDSGQLFQKRPDELLKFGLEEIIKKLGNFDFAPLLSGTLRNLTVGVPQSWGTNKKLLYREILLSQWKYGDVSLLSEPVAATIAAYKRSSADIGKNIIMILDIGASTFDISFARYIEENNSPKGAPDSEYRINSLNIFKTTYRSEKAGHYFDLVFAAFALLADLNKLPGNEIIDRLKKIKLRKAEDYIEFLEKNQQAYSGLLLELETLKENNLLEIVKFNRKKLIDIGTKTPITITKQIYLEALNYYVSGMAPDINNLLTSFRQNEKISEDDRIYPFLCGGASSLNGLEKALKEKITGSESNRLFSILKEGHGNKIDTTIAVGLAYYAQDKSIIAKKLEFSVGITIPSEPAGERKDLWIFNEGEPFPFKNDQKLTEIIGVDQELQYHGNGDGSISFPLLIKNSVNPAVIISEVVSFSMENCDTGDTFDLFFNIDIDGMINIKLENITKNTSAKKTLPVFS